MKLLLYLYPPAWQRRYRREVTAHLQADPASLRTAIDLLAGAVDAWLHPEWIPAPTTPQGTARMITCSRHEPVDISRADATRSAAWMIGVTLVLTTIAMALNRALGDHALIEALLLSSFFIGLAVSTRHTFLRPYSAPARGVIITLMSIGWYAFFATVLLVSQG